MPADIVLFGGDILGKGGTCKKPLIIRVSGEEVKLQRKNKSRKEALLGEYVVFGAKLLSSLIIKCVSSSPAFVSVLL